MGADDKPKYISETQVRHYKESANCLQKIVNEVDIYSSKPKNPEIKTFVSLGDFLDKKTCRHTQKKHNYSQQAFTKLNNILNSSKYLIQDIHCTGNHDFAAFKSREQLINNYMKDKELFGDTVAYITPLADNSRIKFIHIDNFDIAYQRWEGPKFKQAFAILNTQNY